MLKVRLDQLVFERGLVESRSKAQAIIMEGKVRVAGQVVLKPATSVSADAALELEAGPRFVSRGGDKLVAALETFPIHVEGRICADVGSSTGGFTDCLLQHGAAKVYAIDVGKGILHWKMRTDPRVAVMEGTNARHVERLPETVSLVTVDASFISLKVLLPVIRGWFPNTLQAKEGEIGGNNETEVIALIKPQFEAGRKETARGEGVIRDPAVHRLVLAEVLEFARKEGFHLHGLIKSPLTGPKGNKEFLAWLKSSAEDEVDVKAAIDQALG